MRRIAAVVGLLWLAGTLHANIVASDFAGTWSLVKTDPYNSPVFGDLVVVVAADGSVTIQTYGTPAQRLAQASLVGDALKFDVPRTSPYYGDYVISYSIGLDGYVTQTSPTFLPAGPAAQTLTFTGVHDGSPTITQQPYFR